MVLSAVFIVLHYTGESGQPPRPNITNCPPEMTTAGNKCDAPEGNNSEGGDVEESQEEQTCEIEEQKIEYYPRIAVMLIGLTRTFSECKPSFLNHLVLPITRAGYKVDVFVFGDIENNTTPQRTECPDITFFNVPYSHGVDDFEIGKKVHPQIIKTAQCYQFIHNPELKIATCVVIFVLFSGTSLIFPLFFVFFLGGGENKN